jgi:hypothetical protein
MVVGVLRRTKRNYAVNRRYHNSGQNGLEIVKLKRLKPQILATAIAFNALRKNQAGTSPDTVNRYRRALAAQLLVYTRLTRLSGNHVHLKFPARLRTIESYHLQELDAKFRFNSYELLHRLLNVLALPNVIRFRSGNVMSSEECMRLALRRLISRKTL